MMDKPQQPDLVMRAAQLLIREATSRLNTWTSQVDYGRHLKTVMREVQYIIGEELKASRMDKPLIEVFREKEDVGHVGTPR